MSNRVTGSLLRGSMFLMDGRITNGVAGHFGRQMRKERMARGWTLVELGERTGLNAAHLGRVESGKRPPTEEIASACDAVFPERKGWFSEWHRDSRSWMPPGFRSWTEHERSTAHLSVWCPGLIDGLAQTEGYARAHLETMPGAAPEQVRVRVAARMARQQQVLYRESPPSARFVIDEAALYRQVGTPASMAEQMVSLAEMAALPHMSVQVLPQVAHPANSSELIIADDAAYVEHLVGGYVYTDKETFTELERIFVSIQAESYRASESVALLREASERWSAK